MLQYWQPLLLLLAIYVIPVLLVSKAVSAE
jgi:hypothetical protein